jgi:hypothetical protein
MKIAIKLLLCAAPLFLVATGACLEIGTSIARRSPPESFGGLGWYVAASYLVLAAVFSPVLAFVLWIIHRGTRM